MPALVFFLAKMGLVTARFLGKHLEIRILLIFIVAAVMTPAAIPGDQALFALPMIGLYILSIFIAWIVGRWRGAREPQTTHWSEPWPRKRMRLTVTIPG